MGLKKNKSSLLTFEKGSLKTIKGSYAKVTKPICNVISTDISNNVPATQSPAPPEPSELLQLVGVDTQGADTLPSYEESVTRMRDDLSLETPLEQQDRNRRQRCYESPPRHSFSYLIRSRMDSYYVSVPRDASWVTHGS